MSNKAHWEVVKQLDGRWGLYPAQGSMTCYGTFPNVDAARATIKRMKECEGQSVFLDLHGEPAVDPYKDAR